MAAQQRLEQHRDEGMTMMPEIHWSCIARNKVILCEAGEDDTPDRSISKMAQSLMAKKQTPGWEFYRPRRSEYHSIKFHVYDQDLAGDMMVWEFACVYDKALPQDQAQSFLEKLVVLTEELRKEQNEWRYGDTLAAQETFAPTLLQRMDEISYLGRLAMVNDKVDGVKEVMANNIALALEREEKLEDLTEKATKMEEWAGQFKKSAKRIKRFQQWQNAKYGLTIGTAVTAGVAVVAVPPLIALL